jgi:hypothetical protein
VQGLAALALALLAGAQRAEVLDRLGHHLCVDADTDAWTRIRMRIWMRKRRQAHMFDKASEDSRGGSLWEEGTGAVRFDVRLTS